MSKEFLMKLEELNRYQRQGVDQTANYSELFNENAKIVDMARINAVKERVQKGAFYLSRKKSAIADEYLIIDMFNGHVYKINSKLYTVKVAEDNILVIDNIHSREHFLIVDGELHFGDVKHLGISNYTKCSSKKVPAVRFNNSFKDSIKVHHIIALMKWGIYPINKCLGSSKIHRLRHKVAYKKSSDNSINNLQILRGTDNKKY